MRGLVQLDMEKCRKKVYITIPYYNDSLNIKDSWLVSKPTGVPSTNAKSLIPLLEVGG